VHALRLLRFNPLCDAQWRNEDSLVYVANIEHPSATRSNVKEYARGRAVDARRLGPELPTRIWNVSCARPLSSHFARTPERPSSMNSSFVETRSSTRLRTAARADNGDVFFDFEDIRFWSAQTTCSSSSGLRYRDDVASGVTTRAWAHDLTPRPPW